MSRGLIVLAAGGTGGHVFPAQALAEVLQRRGFPLALITDSRGATYGDALGRIDTYRINSGKFSGGVRGKLAGLLRLVHGYFQARGLLRRLRPAVVVGFGGYPSVPTMLAAAGRYPTLIHEQNAVLGRTNRILAARVTRIATSFARVSRIRSADARKVVLTGNPVRAAFDAVRESPYETPLPDGDFRLLVMGGSQGARVLSDVVPVAMAQLPEEQRRRVAIVQQCRPEDLERVAAAYRESGVVAELKSFFEDVPARLADAHLVIARAGASTVAELAEAGRPALLVPYPAATDDHQTANARALVDAGGAWLVPQPEFTAKEVARQIVRLMAAPEALSRAAAAQHGTGRPHAAERLADAVAELVGGGTDSPAIPASAERVA